MAKNIKTKIIAITLLVGITIIGSLGGLYISSINQIKSNITTETNNIEEIVNNVNNIQNESQKIVAIEIILFLLISLAITIYLSKFVIYPKDKFINNDEKKELREELSEVSTEKNQIETILRHMTDGVIAFNKNGTIISINPAAKNFLSIEPEANTFDDVFNKFNLGINIEKVIYLETWASTDQKIQVDDKYVKVIFAPFKNEENRPEGVIAVIQDVTEHVKLDNMQKEFVADVSHELKTPITSIMGCADTLLEGGYDFETQNKFLKVISDESKRMARLVTDLLTLSRYDSKRKTEKELFDLGKLVKETQEKLEIQIKQKGHSVESFVTADVPPVYANKDDIQRVILNILSNSIKYTPNGGKIRLYVGFVYNDAYVKIIDNGIGIPEEDLSRIFERFYRVDKARTRQLGGTGLGLSIAKEILDKNGGSIDIKSKVGEGTEVVIRIPTKVQK